MAKQAIKKNQNNKKINKSDVGDSLLVTSTNNVEQLELETLLNAARDCVANLDSEIFFASYDDCHAMTHQQRELAFNNNDDSKSRISSSNSCSRSNSSHSVSINSNELI